MTISVPQHGKINVSAGKLNRLVITGHGIADPLDVKVKDITSIGHTPTALIVNGIEYPGCQAMHADVALMVKLHQKRMAASVELVRAYESKDAGNDGL
jgi:hypothetical protein